MIEIVNAISGHLIEGLAAAGYPPLTQLLDGSAGRILIGNRHNFEQYMPPRVLFFPTKSTFSVRDANLGTARVADNASGMSAQTRTIVSQRAIATEQITFEVACWGIAAANLYEDEMASADFEFTHALYRQVLASLHHLMPGCYRIEGGAWRTVRHMERAGREFVFGLTVNTPVLAEIIPASETIASGLQFAPSDVRPVVTDEMVIGTGDSSPGCEGDD